MASIYESGLEGELEQELHEMHEGELEGKAKGNWAAFSAACWARASWRAKANSTKRMRCTSCMSSNSKAKANSSSNQASSSSAKSLKASAGS